MNLYLLPGNDSRNREWIDLVGKTFKKFFVKVEIQYYEHWETGGPFIDFDDELEKFERSVRGDKSYVVLGKSVGSLLLLQAVYEQKITPERCIFVGTAVGLARRKNYPIDEWLRSLSIPSMFIQQTDDPATPFESLSKLLAELNVKDYELVEVPGDDHVYRDIELLAHNCEKFVK